jgi:hypothetical protein
MTLSHPSAHEVRLVLQRFQDFYTRRDPALIETFMNLLADDDLEVIGTNGVRAGEEEWYIGKDAARELFLGDWQSWGDVRLDIDGARIQGNENTAWLSAAATVQMVIPAEQNYADYLAFVKKYIETEQLSAEQKLLYILRGGTNTVFELRRGEDFVWPLRFTAVLVKRGETWKFHQMQFSFPTMYFPDVRTLPGV